MPPTPSTPTRAFSMRINMGKSVSLKFPWRRDLQMGTILEIK
jgi:hypothetical protein